MPEGIYLHLWEVAHAFERQQDNHTIVPSSHHIILKIVGFLEFIHKGLLSSHARRHLHLWEVAHAFEQYGNTGCGVFKRGVQN